MSIGPPEMSRPSAISSHSWPRRAQAARSRVVNVPIQLGVSLDSKYNGIGLDFVANVNREVSTFGIALTVSGGEMRSWLPGKVPEVSGEARATFPPLGR